MKILANDGISDSGKEILEKAGIQVDTEKVPQENLIDVLNQENYEGILVRSATQVRKDVIDNCPSLQFIGRGGVGMDNIDVEYAREKNIEVFNTPSASSRSVAELVFAHIFSLYRFLHQANREMSEADSRFKELKKSYSKGTELYGKTILIVGLGRIGSCVAQYALGNGMRVIGVDAHSEKCSVDVTIGEQTIAIDVPLLSLEEALPQADVVTLHVPAQNEPVIGKKEFALMKKNSVLIHAARGGVIDEDALLESLNSEHLLGAGLDVFTGEPTPRKDLLTHPKISLSPHIGAATVEAQDRIGKELADHILRIVKVHE